MLDPQAHTINTEESEPKYTALPDMDLLMSLSKEAQDKVNLSVSGRK